MEFWKWETNLFFRVLLIKNNECIEQSNLSFDDFLIITWEWEKERQTKKNQKFCASIYGLKVAYLEINWASTWLVVCITAWIKAVTLWKDTGDWWNICRILYRFLYQLVANYKFLVGQRKKHILKMDQAAAVNYLYAYW